MREITQEDLRIRRFILGELKGLEREELEELFLTDGAFREKVLMAEDDLIDEYLDGELKGSELEEFRMSFESMPQHSAKFRAARSIHNYAKREYAATYSRSKHHAGFYVAIAASVLVVAMAALWLFNRARENEVAGDESRRIAVEKQLAELNARPANRDEPVSLVLVPVTTRSGNQARLSVSRDGEKFNLLLMPATTQFETFTATLRRTGDQQQYEIPGLRIESAPGTSGVRLRLLASLLDQGQYEILLHGIGPDGQKVDAGTFTFQITG